MKSVNQGDRSEAQNADLSTGAVLVSYLINV